MTGIDPHDVFSLLNAAVSTADTISNDTSLTSADRDAAGRIREALKVWKTPAFRFRDWRPAAKKAATTTTA